jgi:hypothetical protein
MLALMPLTNCPPPGLHRGLHPNHEACGQPVSSNASLEDTFQGVDITEEDTGRSVEAS